MLVMGDIAMLRLNSRLLALPSAGAALLVGLGALGGCASTKINSQWVDPALSGAPLHGAKVLVVCQAVELSIQRLCQEQIAAQLGRFGARAVAGSGVGPEVADRAAAAAQQLPAAKAAGASALWFAAVAPDASYVAPGPSISFGFGGGSWGGGGGGGAGVGISMPVGGSSVSTAYGAESALLNVADGRVLWSAKAVAPPSEQVNQQLADLAKVLAEAAQKANLF